MSGWFEVDREGMRRMSNGLNTLVWEMLQNALDTDATWVDLRFAPESRNRQVMQILDNDPVGYEDLSHAFTLFAPSTKAGDDSKRGFMNIGEKLVLAWTVEGVVRTMSGGVYFLPDGTRKLSKLKRDKTTEGSYHRFVLDIPQTAMEDMITAAKAVLVPEGKRLLVNGEVVESSPVINETKTQLRRLVLEGDEMREREKVTRITLHEPQGSLKRSSFLYVLGMPVQEIDTPWSINVHGRLRQDVKRNQVPEAQVRRIRVAVADLMIDELTKADAEGWARAAIKDGKTETVRKLWELRHGTDTVIHNPRDPEASMRAISNGVQVMYGRTGGYSAEERNRIDEVRQVFPEMAPVATERFGEERKAVSYTIVEVDDWTKDMRRVVSWTKAAFRHLFNEPLMVQIIDSPQSTTLADHSDGRMRFNVGLLGKDWFKVGNEAEQFALIVHEFGHQYHADWGHTEMWANHALSLAGRLAAWGSTLVGTTL